MVCVGLRMDQLQYQCLEQKCNNILSNSRAADDADEAFRFFHHSKGIRLVPMVDYMTYTNQYISKPKRIVTCHTLSLLYM